MILLRLLAIFIFSSLLSGCYLYGDYNSLKSDIRSLKAYLKATPVPNECKPPGTPQSRICYYKLSIKPFDSHRGLYEGHVTPQMVQQAQKDCEATRIRIQQKVSIDDDYKCLDPAKYRYILYGFKIEGAQLTAGDYGFINIPHTEYLRIGKPEEAMWQP